MDDDNKSEYPFYLAPLTPYKHGKTIDHKEKPSLKKPIHGNQSPNDRYSGKDDTIRAPWHLERKRRIQEGSKQ